MGHKYTKILGTEAPEDACLYLGSIDWVIEDEILDDLHIQAIVSVLPKQPQYAEEVLKEHGIDEKDYMVYPLEDSTDEYISLFEAPGVVSACEFIHRKRLEGKSVLVHCDAGITRSPAVVVSYLMKYGQDLHNPKPLSLQEAAAIVRGLRERMDICQFHDELVRLEGLLLKGEAIATPTNGEKNYSFPRTPLLPKDWAEVQEEGDPWIQLGLLHSTWSAIRSMEGGQEAFGRAVYKNVFTLGGQRMEDMYAEVDMQRLSNVMTGMLRQIVWCLDQRNMDHLVKFHRHLQIVTQDFETFHTSIMMALEEKLHLPPEAVAQWEQFLRVVFNRWAKAINQPQLKREAASPKSPLQAAAPAIIPSGCPFAAQAAEKVNGQPIPSGCPFAAQAAEKVNGQPKLALPPRKCK